MRLTKDDIEYLREILENSHAKSNRTSIKACPLESCWYKKIVKYLEKAAKGGLVKKADESTLDNSAVVTKLDGQGHNLESKSPLKRITSKPPRKSHVW